VSAGLLRIEVDGRVYEIACTDVELRTVLLAVEERQANQAALLADVEAEAFALFRVLEQERLQALRKQVELFDRWVWEGDAAFDLPMEQVTAPWPPKRAGRYTWPEPRRRRR
jgi:hypothetical protein